MKPIKSLTIVANWLLRLSIVVFVVVHYFYALRNIDIKNLSLNVLAMCLFAIFGILLFIGGFRSKPRLTVVSALIISLLSVFFAYINYSGTFLNVTMMNYLFPFSIGIYFLANGNK